MAQGWSAEIRPLAEIIGRAIAEALDPMQALVEETERLSLYDPAPPLSEFLPMPPFR